MVETAVREISIRGLSLWYKTKNEHANPWHKTKLYTLSWQQSTTVLLSMKYIYIIMYFFPLTCCTIGSTAYGQGLCLNRTLQVKVAKWYVKLVETTIYNYLQLLLVLHTYTSVGKWCFHEFCNCCFSRFTSRAGSASESGPCLFADFSCQNALYMLTFFLLVFG